MAPPPPWFCLGLAPAPGFASQLLQAFQNNMAPDVLNVVLEVAHVVVRGLGQALIMPLLQHFDDLCSTFASK